MKPQIRSTLLRLVFAASVGLASVGLASVGLASAATIEVLPYEGPITPVASRYLVDGIAHAASEHAEAVVILLDTPGGLDTSMREIVKAILGAELPVVVYVAPSGSRAASAGVFITMAAHVAAMSPGTNIGSASPVSMGGGSMDSTMVAKVTHDAEAYIESIAADRGRNAELARRFVSEAHNITAEEAVEENVVDLVAEDLAELLDAIHGRTVEVNGAEWVLDTEGATILERPMNARQRFLKALADPNVAYILMLLGIYGLFFELSNPGSLVPGILGGICLLLALFAFQSLPINYAGVALMLLGVIMLILEVKVTSYGALTIGGLISLVLGSLLLFDDVGGWGRVSLRVMIPALAVFSGFFILCAWLVIRGQQRAPVTGTAALVGEHGRVVEAIPGGSNPGKVAFHGELWDAVSDSPLEVGVRVEVIAIEGRIARIREVDSI